MRSAATARPRRNSIAHLDAARLAVDLCSCSDKHRNKDEYDPKDDEPALLVRGIYARQLKPSTANLPPLTDVHRGLVERVARAQYGVRRGIVLLRRSQHVGGRDFSFYCARQYDPNVRLPRPRQATTLHPDLAGERGTSLVY